MPSHASSSSSSSSSTPAVPSVPAPAYSEPRRQSRDTRRQHRRGPSSDYIIGGALPSPQQTADPMRTQYDALGAFFAGAQTAPATFTSHHQGHAATASLTAAAVPPPYRPESRSDIESLPSYTKEEEYSAELNRKLFMYGFLFFPLWIVGIIAPFVKPYRDPAKDNRSKEDQELEDKNMRAVEVKWAWRCLFALLTFSIIITVAVVGALMAVNHHKN